MSGSGQLARRSGPLLTGIRSYFPSASLTVYSGIVWTAKPSGLTSRGSASKPERCRRETARRPLKIADCSFCELLTSPEVLRRSWRRLKLCLSMNTYPSTRSMEKSGAKTCSPPGRGDGDRPQLNSAVRRTFPQPLLCQPLTIPGQAQGTDFECRLSWKLMARSKCDKSAVCWWRSDRSR